ncbi:hypothetical protein ACIBIZ_13015 [Nonomuraea spiralis]|uniref:hypothetical protein n=1 Tax=Nonomuraea TaxID=83681 RepID=UPI000F7666B7|nr:hypothetical protein [Nonomuraea sp. WAC 01424]RSN11770.1 hypothetical protein DMB42_14500 [Nonomuraea sp. WAC 01424]
MSDEQDLIRTLRTAADQVERRDLVASVARRRRARRTRQRVKVLLAAVAVVVIAGGTTAIVSGEDGRDAPPAVQVTPSSSVPAARPAAELWPKAVVKVPMRDSEGRGVQLVTGLGTTEVLLVVNSAFEKAGRLEVYDSASGTTRALGDIPSPRKKYYPQLFAASREYIAWFGTTPQDSVPWADFWVMPAQGGKARRVGEVDADVDRIALAGDSLVWSVKEGGVYRMPLTGGAPERLPATDGLHLMAWPWAAGLSDDRPFANQNRVVNLETGRSADVALPEKAEGVQCDAQWCVGMLDEHVLVQRIDGSGRRTLPQGLRLRPGRTLLGGSYALFRVYDPDRYKSGVPIAMLYDLATGTMAGVGERSVGVLSGNVGAGASFSSPSTAVFWDADEKYYEQCANGQCQVKTRGGGKEYTVLNLAAVTR